MKIIVAGCGKIGTAILSSLVTEGHDVVAVDNDRSVIEDITNIYDVMGVNGNASDYDTLTEAGVNGVDIYIAAKILTSRICFPVSWQKRWAQSGR